MIEMTSTAVLRRWIDAVNNLDFETGAALFAQDAVLKIPLPIPGYPTKLDGRDAIGEFLAMVGQLMTSLKLSDIELFGTDDPEVAIGTAHGDAVLHNGDTYTQDYVFFMRVRDGEIVEYREYFDPNRAAAALATTA